MKNEFYEFLLRRIRRFSRRDVTQDGIVWISDHRTEIGRFTYGEEHISILSWGSKEEVSIGRFCSISFGLKLFVGGNHRIDWLTTYPFGHIYAKEMNLSSVSGHPASNGGIKIGNDVWIGRDVSIMSGVSIGDGSVIAANSTVVSDVAPFSIVGGNPARFIRDRFSMEVKTRLASLKWWEYPLTEISELVPFLCCQNSNNLEENIEKIESILSRIRPHV